MNSTFKKLTEKQIRTQYFFMPTFCLKLAFGDEMYEQFISRKKIAEDNGFSYELMGWPNGVTVFLKRPMPHRNLGDEDLVSIYKSVLSGPEDSIAEVTLC